MSTRFTKGGVPMVESQSLQLVQATARVNDQVAKLLAMKLQEKGYSGITPSLLGFLGALECGVNYGSEIARNLGVSRQMVAKTAKELCHAGYLQQEDDIGRQKRILFTAKGEQLMSQARALLSELDSYLAEGLGKNKLNKLLNNLAKVNQALEAHH
ncbi:MarR family winged helix-turn-helix transcriptional regulator [Aliiglaciecola sp. CAU 1673]|uniref:MarR family winged helix-turn-helix transcriptional regulator n=1 Tax=Aliiglaciecola sp. CAU 1673 TaxID=3032595 RepID=UPI0023DCA846|nr:MarR family winged helix-turn-helix transcriptional regulator [Aliiglaciecola sp. CAU 1673]MDF2177877.1 MarR family winged helix-turn-helix transcriptional regulator [Aliiglaciecola sp. CAU 1673]